MRRRDTLDPKVERELAELDAALAGDVRGDDPASAGSAGRGGEASELRGSAGLGGERSELAAFVRAVRAERPAPSERFAAELDAWAASGFAPASAPPSRGGRARPRFRVPSLRGRLPRRGLLPALGVAASLLAGLAVTGALVSGGGESQPSRPAALPERAPADTQALESATPAAPTPAGDAVASPGAAVAPGRPRRVERQASLVLTAAADEVAGVADRVIRATDEVRGIVVTSSVSSGDGSEAGASFQLRVPAHRLDDALAKLSKLGHVRSRTQDSQDVTGSFVSARERLDESLAERKSLLRRLAAADTENETASIRARLRIVRSEIAGARGALRRLRVRTDRSAVSVTVEAARGGGTGGAGGGSWTPSDAVRDAVRVLEVFAGALLIGLAILLPLAAFGAALVLGGRLARRRRRASALSTG